MNLATPALATKLVLTFLLLASPIHCNAAELILSVSNIKNAKGHLMISVFDAAEHFEHKTDPIASQTIAASKGAVEVVFKNLPSGEIAVAIFHDKNDNNKLDTNFLGIPKEGFAFSTIQKANLGHQHTNSALLS